MAKHRFKDNASEETVSVDRKVTPTASSQKPTFEITADISPEVEAILREADLPAEMARPVLKDESPKLVPPKIQPEKIKARDVEIMNAGIEKLLEYLPDDAVELLREYALSQEAPLWQVVGGYIMRCRDNGEMFSPNILPDWADMISPNAIRACGTCGEAMKPAFMGQGFCCNWCASGKLHVFGHNSDCSKTAA